MMKTSWMVLGLVAAVATAACGDDTGGTGGAGTGASSSGAGGDAASTGGGSGDTSSTGAGEGGSGPGAGGGDEGGGTGSGGQGGGGTGGEAPVTGPRGAVTITTYNYLPDTPATLVEGAFLLEPECEVVATSGACRLDRCLVSPEYLDAGALALAGGDLPPSVAFDYYEDLDGHLVDGGDVVAVTGPGSDDVPAFELGATFPVEATMTSPSFEDGTIVLSDDFPVAWSGGGDGSMVVTVDGSFEPEAETFERITCSVPASAGALTIPGAILAQIQTSGDAVFVSARVMATDRVTVDDWTFDLAVGRFGAADASFTGDATALYEIQ
jgi:hypothetical protein